MVRDPGLGGGACHRYRYCRARGCRHYAGARSAAIITPRRNGMKSAIRNEVGAAAFERQPYHRSTDRQAELSRLLSNKGGAPKAPIAVLVKLRSGPRELSQLIEARLL